MKLVINRTSVQGIPTTAVLSHDTGKIITTQDLETLAGKQYVSLDGALRYISVDSKDLVGRSVELAIEWNVALFDKMSFSGEFDVFEEINQFWERLSKAKQDAVFDVYVRIKDAFDINWETKKLTQALYPLVAELYTYHELDQIKHWYDFYSTLVIPTSIEKEFVPAADNSRTRDRTYCQEDYKWLTCLTITLRTMIPIWGEFIQRTKKEIGTVFKEFYARRLLNDANIVKSGAMEKLLIYVTASIPSEKSKSSPILDGLSTEDYPTWMLSMVLVRRLSIGDVRGIDNSSNLATFIYKYIGQKSKGHDSSFIGLVKDKLLEGQGQEGENNLSKLEGYKIKQEISDGDICIIGYHAKDVYNNAKRICPDLPEEIIRASFQSIVALENEQIWDPQITLVQWVMRKVIPPRGVQHISKITTLQNMAVTQALLWYKGYHELAALVTAVEETTGDTMRVDFDSRARIKKEQMEMLDELYPYYRRPAGKQKAVKRTNAAADAVDIVANGFIERNWMVSLPPEWVAQVTGNKNNRRLTVPHDIKVKLADLSIAIARREF